MALTTLRRKKQVVTKCYAGPLAWTESEEQPELRKIYTSFGTWNLRSLYKAGSLVTVAEDETNIS
jgi:hypothetical protein